MVNPDGNAENEKSMSELEDELSKLDDEDFDDETKDFAKKFIIGLSDIIKESEGRLVRALANGDTGELTGHEIYRYIKTLPVETYITIFGKMYADMKIYHPDDLKSLEEKPWLTY